MVVDAKERRKYARVPSQIRLRYQVLQIPMKSRMKEGRIIDISGGGVAFVVDAPLNDQDVLKVEVQIPDYHKALPESQIFGPVVSLAKVVRQWVNDNGEHCVAVKFVDIYTKHQEELLEYVLRRLKRLRK